MSEQQEFSLGPFDGELAARVAAARGHLSGADQQILAYLTDNPDGVAFHTAESLGAKAAVSRAAVVRFARKLGYTGFTEFRLSPRPGTAGHRAGRVAAGDGGAGRGPCGRPG